MLSNWPSLLPLPAFLLHLKGIDWHCRKQNTLPETAASRRDPGARTKRRIVLEEKRDQFDLAGLDSLVFVRCMQTERCFMPVLFTPSLLLLLLLNPRKINRAANRCRSGRGNRPGPCFFSHT